MSRETKKFLITLAVIALAGWIGGNWLLGPPGLSPAYLAAHRAEHDHYVEIIKSAEYKRYIQRPHLVELDGNPVLAERVAFVENYTAAEAFEEEQHRIELYSLFFELFNAGLVLVLVLRLGKAPLFAFLGEQIETLREKLNQAARSRKSAESRLTAAEEKIANLPALELGLHAETEQRLERELSEYSEANHYRMGLQERELAERKKAAVHNAELALKQRLVDSAIDSLVAKLKDGQSVQQHTALLDDFLNEIEAER